MMSPYIKYFYTEKYQHVQRVLERLSSMLDQKKKGKFARSSQILSGLHPCKCIDFMAVDLRCSFLDVDRTT